MSKLTGYEMLPDEIQKAVEYTIYWHYNLFTRYGIEKEDLMQVAALAYFEWLEDYGNQNINFDKVCGKIKYAISQHIKEVKETSNIIQFTDYSEASGLDKMTIVTELVSYSIDPEEIVMEEELKFELLDAVDVLTERERHIFMSISWSETPKTMEEVGRELGITKQRVSVIHNTAMGKVREAFNKKS